MEVKDNKDDKDVIADLEAMMGTLQERGREQQAPWQRRVIEERDELSLKLDKLGLLIKSNMRGIHFLEKIRLLNQYEYMLKYFNILEERISAFKQ